MLAAQRRPGLGMHCLSSYSQVLGSEKVCSRVQITRSSVQVAIALYATYRIEGLKYGESRPGLGLKRSGV